MKWDVKHDRAKRVIDAFLEGAENWQKTGEFVVPKRSDITGDLEEDEREMVNEEVRLMIASIRKRYKLDVRLPQQMCEIKPKEEEVVNSTEEVVETKPEPLKEDKKEEKPKRTRKAATGEKKAPARKPRAKKESKTEE